MPVHYGGHFVYLHDKPGTMLGTWLVLDQLSCLSLLLRQRAHWGLTSPPFPCSPVCTQLLVSRPDEENITSYLQLIEKCLTHEVRPSLDLPRRERQPLLSQNQYSLCGQQGAAWLAPAASPAFISPVLGSVDALSSPWSLCTYSFSREQVRFPPAGPSALCSGTASPAFILDGVSCVSCASPSQHSSQL